MWADPICGSGKGDEGVSGEKRERGGREEREERAEKREESGEGGEGLSVLVGMVISDGRWNAGADPRFPVEGGTNHPWGAPTYEFAKFSKKLHEIEKILGRGGGHVPGAPPKCATGMWGTYLCTDNFNLI